MVLPYQRPLYGSDSLLTLFRSLAVRQVAPPHSHEMASLDPLAVYVPSCISFSMTHGIPILRWFFVLKGVWDLPSCTVTMIKRYASYSLDSESADELRLLQSFQQKNALIPDQSSAILRLYRFQCLFSLHIMMTLLIVTSTPLFSGGSSPLFWPILCEAHPSSLR